MNLKKTSLFFLTLFLVSSGISSGVIAARLSYPDLKKSGQKKIEFVKILIKEIPDIAKSAEEALLIESRFESLLAEYDSSANRDKKNTLSNIHAVNLKLDDIIRTLNEQLAELNKKIIKNFSVNLHKAEVPPPKDNYFNQYKVAKQENDRAIKAFRSNQMVYAANLFKRSIIIMRALNQKLNWSEIERDASSDAAN